MDFAQCVQTDAQGKLELPFVAAEFALALQDFYVLGEPRCWPAETFGQGRREAAVAKAQEHQPTETATTSDMSNPKGDGPTGTHGC